MLIAFGLVVSFASTATAADFVIKQFDVEVGSAESGPELQAGAHPDIITTIQFPTTETFPGSEEVVGNPKDVIVDTPPGVVGTPTLFASCAGVDLAARGNPTCSDEAQVGMATVDVLLGGFKIPLGAAIYSVEPPPGVAARFGFSILGVLTILDAVVDSHGEYHVQVRSLESSQGLSFSAVKVKLWGVPASKSHDSERGLCALSGGGSCPTDQPLRPFLSNPTSCDGNPLRFGIAVNSWQEPGRVLASSVDHDTSGNPLVITGCEKVPFAPRMTVQPTSQEAGAPTGLHVELSMPQSDDPGGLAQANLRDAKVTLPAGMTISPASADGLETCSDAQLGLGSVEHSACPPGSKLGDAVLVTPALVEPLEGSIYLRPQASGDPESGDMYRLALELTGETSGVDVKLPGSIRASRADGRLVATFDDNPQLPFSSLKLDFKTGPRAALRNPPQCGEASVRARFTSWSGAEVDLEAPFVIGRRCGQAGFSPSLEAGVSSPLSGSPAPFALRVVRPDGEPNIAAIEATLPEGLLAKLAGVPLCGSAQAVAGTCPASSKIGSATVGVGPGSNPIYVPRADGKPTSVYLGGPYRGAPYSLVVEVPAKAGPFDLGTVLVRNALSVDPLTARVTAKSDPLPQILGGIPIEYRDIRIAIDRPDFTLNPTNCDPMEVKGTIGSAEGKSANVSDRFQVANCERLGFKPKLALTLSGAPTRRGGYPKLRAELTMPKGGANVSRAQVLLPKTELLENAHIRTICTRVQYAAQDGGGGACPAASIYGYAKAWTPLLDQPLGGPVYLRSSSHQLPDLVASLDGQIHIDLVGRIDARNARIRNTFESVPDAPVSKFVLTMQGGKKGLLANTTNICRNKPRADVRFVGQNGKVADSSPLVKVPNCGKRRK